MLTFQVRYIWRSIAVASAVVLAAAASANELIVNGGFESGLSGWTGSANLGDAFDPLVPATAGYLAVGSGYVPPSVGFAVLDPYAGSSYALGDATSAGAYTLIQDFTLPAGTISAMLSFAAYVYDWSGQSTVGDGFDFTTALNQNVRVDILRGGADDFSVDPADVVASLFSGASSDPNVNWATSNFDLTGTLTAGQSYRLRFATVASTFVISHGIDDVSLQYEAVPEPTTMLALGAPLLALARRRRTA